MKKIKIIVSSILLSLLAIPCMANNYVAIAKNGNVYDEASAKYVTLNQNNDEVSVIPGMVFETSQHTPGWYKVQYSPGLHAFIPESITAGNYKQLQPGTYEIKNNPGHKLAVQCEGDNWTASTDGKSYKGVKSEDILIFLDNTNNVAFSLVDLGTGPIAITYDNSVTKFF